MVLRPVPFLRRNRAFTMIEIMLVVVILGILTAVVVPRLVGRAERTRISATRSSLNGIRTALGSFEVEVGRFPTTSEGLESLVDRPTGISAEMWGGPYLDEVPRDAWGREFVYKSPGERNRDYDLFSRGPDGQENTDDDVSMARGAQPTAQ